ncbi:phytanoyl-CoA dioxygenase family protein [Cytobacillus pseudoceanisediminis]|uniref:phytanoyl-CoA dioxygenase family protein n=1 Tax=Cytobacillus pseudoceanisediminis TaxID=3051614 RepID=UPI003C2CA885
MQDYKTQNLPLFQNAYTLTEEQIEQYQKDGHIRLDAVATTEEIDAYRPHFLDLIKRLNNRGRPHNERFYYEKALQHTMNMWRRSEIIKNFVFAKRFAKIAADLMGVDKVRINHDCALIKEPFSKKTPRHIDQVTWAIDTEKTITMWMPLTEVTEEMGTLTYYTGTHLFPNLRYDPEKHLVKAMRKGGLPTLNYGAMKAGDATFHSGYILHESTPNNTDKTREIMTIIYYGDTEDATIVAPEGDEIRQTHARRYFPGLKHGDHAASTVNPILYDRTEDK